MQNPKIESRIIIGNMLPAIFNTPIKNTVVFRNRSMSDQRDGIKQWFWCVKGMRNWYKQIFCGVIWQEASHNCYYWEQKQRSNTSCLPLCMPPGKLPGRDDRKVTPEASRHKNQSMSGELCYQKQGTRQTIAANGLNLGENPNPCPPSRLLGDPKFNALVSLEEIRHDDEVATRETRTHRLKGLRDGRISMRRITTCTSALVASSSQS